MEEIRPLRIRDDNDMTNAQSGHNTEHQHGGVPH